MKVLSILAKLCAVLAGLLLIFMVVMTCGSIIGREFLDKTIPGDFELVALATGAVVGLFMPYCQLHRGNIVIDFFTMKVPKPINDVLDRIGAFTLAVCFLLLAWRSAIGGHDAWETQTSTMLLGFPEWTAYVTMVPGFALTGIIGLWQAIFGFGTEASHGHGEIQT